MGYGAGDSNLYRYVSNAPLIATDPSGSDSLAAFHIDQLPLINSPTAPALSYFGSNVGKGTLRVPELRGVFYWGVDWGLSKPSDRDLGGYVLQHITVVKRKNGKITFKTPDYLDYWEAFEIPPNSKRAALSHVGTPKQLEGLIPYQAYDSVDWFSNIEEIPPSVKYFDEFIVGQAYYFDGMTTAKLKVFCPSRIWKNAPFGLA